MPADEVQVKSIPAVRVAELTGVAASFGPDAIGPVLGPLFGTLAGQLAAAGLTPAGPAMAYYDDGPGGSGVLVHAAIPISAEPPAGAPFAVVDLPAIERAATIVHRGPMDRILVSIQALARWIEATGSVPAGKTREIYLDCDGDQETWVTELAEPLKTS